MPQIESCAVLEPSRPPAPDRYCPVCDEARDHPQPFRNYDGRWFCGQDLAQAQYAGNHNIQATPPAEIAL